MRALPLALLVGCNSVCPDDRPFDRGGTWLGGECWRGFEDVPYGYGYYDYDVDTGTDPALLVMSISHNCADTSWRFEFETNGLNGGALLHLDQPVRDITEEHVIPGVEVLSTELAIVATPEEVVPGVSTVLVCDDEPEVVFRVDLFDRNGNLADCVVWSGANVDPEEVWGPDSAGCANANQW